MADTTSPYQAWDDFWYQDSLPGAGTHAGVSVSPESALRASVVSASVRILSSTVAMLPLVVYERVVERGRRGKRRADTHQTYRTLHDRPNEYQTPFEFKEQLVASLATRGNAYNEKVWIGGKRQLWPIHPDHVRARWLDRKSGRRRLYDVSSSHDGVARVLEDGAVWHPHLLSLDGGLTGASPIRLAAEGIGTTLAANIHASRYYGSGTRLSGYLKLEGEATKEQREEIERSWVAAHAGAALSWKTPVLQGGLSYHPLSVNAADAQLVEFMKWSVSDLARVWGIPLALLQETEKSTSWGSGIEQFMIMLKTYTLAPYLTRIAQGATANLITDTRRYFAEFVTDALLMTDLKSRYEAYAQAVNANNPWLTRNEIRAIENMNPDADQEGERFLVPTNNVAPSGSNGKAAHTLELLAGFLQSELQRRSAETEIGS